MITEIRIRNFQAHKKRRIGLGRVTTIVGPSDAGKSAVIRAIIWTLTNKPSGEQMIRTGTKDAVVEVDWDGHTIRRSRGKGGNLYHLDGQELKAFGSKVPEQITAITNITADSPQIQQQYDQPYWLSETSGEVARRFNTLIGLDLIDSTMKTLSLAIRRKETEQDLLDGQLKEAVTERDALAWAAAAAEEFKELKRLRQVYQESTADHQDLAAMLVVSDGHAKNIANLRGLREDFLPVLASARLLRDNRRELTELAELVTKAGQLTPQVIDLPTTMDTALVGMAHTAAAEAYVAHRNLGAIIHEYRTITAAKQTAEAELEEAEAVLHDMACPECGQPNAFEGEHHHE